MSYQKRAEARRYQNMSAAPTATACRHHAPEPCALLYDIVHMDWLSHYVGSVQFTGWLFQRCLAAIYLIAFIAALDQFPALLGEKGLLPTPLFLRQVSFRQAPSLFHWRYSDRLLKAISWVGVVLSAGLLFAVNDHLPWWVSTVSWLVMWALYMSIVNVGQTFYAFGWESMLLEAGFFTAFIGPGTMVTSAIPLVVLRWMLFRTELGAGLIKIRHDKCWRDLTCLYYHHETQPLPNPLSYHFHHAPKWFHKAGVVFSHFVQIVVPFGLFLPQPISAIAGAFCIVHQLILIVSGNYAWLNWITVFLGITAFNDATLGAAALQPFHTHLLPHTSTYTTGMYALLAAVVVMSVQPTINLFSKNQAMNASYNPFHIINTYGAFGSVSKVRFEVVLEGTTDETLTADTQWKEYQFRAKPGALKRRPPQVAPYHLRLDWLMWFIPFSVFRQGDQLVALGYEDWFVRFVQKLLEGDAGVLRLMGKSPFGDEKPTYVRARYYVYEFTTAEEKRKTGDWWKRELIGEYLPPVSLEDIRPVAAL